MNRVIKIVLLIIIPVLVAAGVATYSYYRYQDFFFSNYMSKAAYKDTEDTIDRYMMFNDTYYELYDKKDVENEAGDDLFTIAIFREFGVTEESVSMYYTLMIYNVDYENVYRTIPGYDDTKLHKFNNYLATFRLTITDAADEDNVISKTFSTNTNYSFNDYKFTGVGDTQKWQDGTKITSAYVKWAQVDVSEYTISENVKMEITCIDSQYPNDADGNNFKALTKDYTDFYTSTKKLDTTANTYNGKELTVCYDQNIKKAGYGKYVFANWMWWEALLGAALTLVITGSTVVVWQGEEKKELDRKAKIDAKKANK